MNQHLHAALGSLAESAASAKAGPAVEARLESVGELLGDDLRWVEDELRQSAAQGPSPGSDASRQLVSLGGKRIRPTAVLLSAACFGPIRQAAREVAVCVELVHSATLLHDDVIDEGTERRGEAAARLVWGNAVSVLGGDLLLTHALLRVEQHAPELLREMLGTLRSLVEGEVVQLRGRRQIDVSEQTYETILRDKTASLFRFATRAGAALGGASQPHASRFATFGECVGMAFQLVDDLLDYTAEDTGKTMFADLRQGKLTLPLVLAVQRQPALLEVLGDIRAGDDSKVESLRRAVVESGVCAEVSRRAARFTQRALAELRHVPTSRASLLLEGIAERLASRSN